MAKALITGARPGPPAVVQYLVNRLYAEMQKLKNRACKEIDRTLRTIRKHGHEIPYMDGWSCDQKVAYVVGLGVPGILLLETAKLGEWVVTHPEIRRNLRKAEDAVRDLSKRLRIPHPKFEFPKVGGTAAKLGRKIGIGGLSDCRSPTLAESMGCPVRKKSP